MPTAAMATVARTFRRCAETLAARCVQKLTNSSGFFSSLVSAFATTSGDNRAPLAGQWRRSITIGTTRKVRVESPPLMRLAWAALLCLILPASAFAVGQGESALTGGPGLALALDGEPRAGAGADVRILRGLSDSWAARLGIQATWIPATGARSATRVAAQALGLTFAADIFKLVPFVDLGLVVADIRGGGQEPRQRLGGQFGIGAD